MSDALVIGCGGARRGLDAAGAIRCGVELVGLAGALLPAAMEGEAGIIEVFATAAEQLRICCFCTGSSSAATLCTPPLQVG